MRKPPLMEVSLRIVNVQPASMAATEPTGLAPAKARFVTRIVAAVAAAHLLNDLIQATLPAIYPMLKDKYQLSFSQIGVLAMVYQITASLFQPLVGMYTDRRSMPAMLPLGMVITLLGVAGIAFAGSYEGLIFAASVIGIGSATFHPEASRVARMASGGRFGIAQSAFQVGGNSGAAMGPLFASAVILPFGQSAYGWLAIAAVAAIWILHFVTRWRWRQPQPQVSEHAAHVDRRYSGPAIIRALVVIAVLMFAKFIYIAAITNYFTFYLIERFDITAREAQFYLFCFLGSVAAGTFFGGPIGDRIGRKAVIWMSFLGVAPFAVMMPHANLFWTAALSIAIGLVLSSAFAALVVYAQEMVPGRVGLVSGMMFGLMFGISGIGAAAMGEFADRYGIVAVFGVTAYLPLLGIATALLPGERDRLG